PHAAVLLHTRHAPDHRTGRCPAIAPFHKASRLPRVGQTYGRTSVGDPSETLHACRQSAVVEEAKVACEPAEVPEQYCSGWPSSASGAGSTAPGSGVEASVSRYPGCSGPGLFCPCCWSEPLLVCTI